jgi:serine/threonine-protein kinase
MGPEIRASRKTVSGSTALSGIASETIQAGLARVLENRYFCHSARLSRFLRFAVERAIQGRSDELKEYIIGLEVFDRKETYDPRVDPIVRVEASRLRSKLKKYYLTDGKDDPIEIQIPVGTYAPVVLARQAEKNEPAPLDSSGDPPPHVAARRDWRIRALILSLAVSLAVTLALAISRREAVSASIARSTPDEAIERYRVSIAVLPFTDLSPGKDQEYFSVGLTEEIVDVLTRVPGLRVVPYSAALSRVEQKRDVRRMGRELNVAYMLEGSVRKDRDRLRISARVTDVFEGHTLWTETYENTINDVFAVQEQISKSMVASLRGRLSVPADQPLSRAHTPNIEAYNLYLKGRYHSNRRTPESLRKGVEFLEQAVAKDPRYALAFSGLADAYALLASYGSRPPGEVLPKAKTAALKAIEIDPTLAEAHSSLGFIYLYQDWNLAEAEKGLRRALQLKPQSATANHWYAYLCMLTDRLDDAIEYAKVAEQLDPLSPNIKKGIADIYTRRREYDKAIEKCQEALDLDSSFVTAYSLLARAYEGKGMFREAIAALDKARELSHRKEFDAAIARSYALWGKTDEGERLLQELRVQSNQSYIQPFYMALAYAAMANPDPAVDWLEKAYDERSPLILGLRGDTRFDKLRREPRFTALLKKIP